MQKIQASKAVKALKNKKGFTLIEIIVVLVILAIMAAALIPTMMGYVDDARQKSQLATAHAYYVAAQAVVAEQMGLANQIVAADFVPAADGATTGPGLKWRDLTAALPGAGAKPSTTVKEGCEVTLAGTGTTAYISKIRFIYADGKNVNFAFKSASSAPEITYDAT